MSQWNKRQKPGQVAADTRSNIDASYISGAPLMGRTEDEIDDLNFDPVNFHPVTKSGANGVMFPGGAINASNQERPFQDIARDTDYTNHGFKGANYGKSPEVKFSGNVFA